jgi:hypothetical protein
MMIFKKLVRPMGTQRKSYPKVKAGRRRLPQLPVEDITTHRVPIICAFLWEPQQALLAVSGMFWDFPELTKNWLLLV